MTMSDNVKTRAHDAKADAKVHAKAEPAAPAAAATAVEVLELKGIDVSLPVRFSAGFVCDAIHAKILETACRRQFKNNMDANISNRDKRLAASKTEAEKAANAPYTAAEIAALWGTYLPAIGDTPRQGSAERLEGEARYNAYVAAIAQHNDNVTSGKPGIFSAPGVLKNALIPAKKSKGVSEEAHKVYLAEMAEKRSAFLEKFASMPKYAPLVEAERIKLRTAAKAEDKPDVAAAGDDVL